MSPEQFATFYKKPYPEWNLAEAESSITELLLERRKLKGHLKRANTLLWAASTLSLLQSAAAWAWFFWGSP